MSLAELFYARLRQMRRPRVVRRRPVFVVEPLDSRLLLSGTPLELAAALVTSPEPGVQVVAPDAASLAQNAAPGSPVIVGVEYGAVDPTLAGLSLRVHLDSTKLVYQGLSNVLDSFRLTPPPTPAQLSDDLGDLDGTPATDKYFVMAWADLSGDPVTGEDRWPGTSPAPLFTLNALTAPGFTSGSTTINFTAAETAPGHTFAATPATITAQAVAPPRLDLTLVKTPTTTDAAGEVAALPASAPFVHEWEPYFVELWGSTPAGAEGIASFRADLSYAQALTTATAITYGPAFTQAQTGAINDVTGVVDDIGGATALTGVGDDQFVLLARVRFDPTGADAAAVDEATHVIGPYPLGLGLTDGRASLTGAGAIAPTLGGAPATAMWGVVYDINDSESINLTDYNAFRAAFNQPVDNTTPDTAPFTWWADFSKSGATVNLTDYNLFRGNFNKSRLGGQPLVLPANFPTAWVPAPSGASAETEALFTEAAAPGSLVDVELVAVATPTSTDTVATLPLSLTTVGAGGTYVVEVWVQSLNGEGIVGGFVDLLYTTAQADVVGAPQHGGVFTDLVLGTVNEAAGLVDDLGGAVSPSVTTLPGIAPQWARLGFVTLTSTGTGPVTFTARESIPFALENTEPLPGQVDFDSITLNAAANRPPVVDDQTFSVPENSANGTVVGTIVVTDPDAGDTRSFAVTGGTGQTAFAVSASTGVITVADRAQLDFETRPSFTLNVTATDGGGLSDTAVVTINLTDVSELPASILVDVELVAVTTPTTTDLVTTLPTSLTTVGAGSGYVVEVWVQSLRGEGIIGGFVDLLYTTTQADVVGAPQHGGVFTDLALGTVNEAAGLVDDLGGAIPPATTALPGIAPQWARLAFVNLTATGTGPVTFTARESIPFALEVTEPLPSQIDFDTLTLNAQVNRAPVAADNSATTPEDVAVTVAVLANDSDADGQPLTPVNVSAPAHGTATVNPNRTITYTPAKDYFGPDSFTYQASDGSLLSNVATVSLTVTPVDDAPVANPDVYTLNEGGTLTVPAPGVLANDTDVDSPTTLEASIATSPQHAVQLRFNPDGSLTYVHDGTDPLGTDSFIYFAFDGRNFSDAGTTVTFVINALDDHPHVNPDSYSVTRGGTLTQAAPGVLGNDTDIADGAPETLRAILASAPLHAAAFTLNLDGSFTYVHDGTSATTDTFTYRASDGENVSDQTATVTITIVAANVAPVAANDSYTTNEDTALTVAAPGVLANDTDVDGETLTAALVTGPAHGTLTLNANGSFTYTPAANYNGARQLHLPGQRRARPVERGHGRA